MQIMMNYQSSARSNRSKAFMVQNVLTFAFFLAFTLWLLYQIRQSYTWKSSYGGTPVGKFSEHDINIFGRKGSVGWPNSNKKIGPLLPFHDVTNPFDIDADHKKKEDEYKRWMINQGTLDDGNAGNTSPNEKDDGVKEIDEKGAMTKMKSEIPTEAGQNYLEYEVYPFADETGLPKHVHDKFVGISEATESDKETRTIVQSVIATYAGNGVEGSVEDS